MMAEMPLEGACGLKFMVGFDGTRPGEKLLARMRAGAVSGVTLFRSRNVSDPAQVRALTAALQANGVARGRPPLLVAADQEGGQLVALAGTTPFPGNMALGAAGSEELTRRTGRAIGRELAAMGVNVNYAPVCDVNNNPANPCIGIRSFGEDPAAVARHCAAMVEGLQSAGVAATAKHFPGLGDTTQDSHSGLPVVTHGRERLAAVELPPFTAAFMAGARLVMATHAAFPALNDGAALPSTLSRPVLEGLLRGEMSFDGVIITDAMDMGAIEQGPGLVVDALASLAAGTDLLLCTDEAEPLYAAVCQAARRRLLPPGQLRGSARRVLALREWLGRTPQPPLEVVACADHRALARETAARSITLVRDETGQLPLQLPAKARVAAILPEPADLTPADTSSHVRCELASALRRYHPAVDEFIVPYAPAEGDIAALCERAQGYDLLIAGTTDAFRRGEQAALIRVLLATGVPLVAVGLRLPYDLASYPMVPTFLCTYSILESSMEALAAALWGEGPIGGRLPVSIPGMYTLGHGVAR
jgi:beta-N-acetylhexosaminidase